MTKFPMDSYFKQMQRACVPQFDFSNPEKAGTPGQIQALQQEGRAKLRQLLRLEEIPFPLEQPRVTLLEPPVDRGFYTREKILLEICHDLAFPVYLLRPKDKQEGKQPMVIACAGHGYGVKEALGLDPQGQEEVADPGYQKRFPEELCRKGFTVAAPEIFNFGDTAFTPAMENGDSSCVRGSVQLLMLGLNTCGLRVFQMQRVVDYLLEQEQGDPAGLWMMGISGGGMLTAFTAAVDTRIQGAVVSGYLSSFRDSILSIPHCLCNFVPDLLRYFEMQDLAALIAPRPLFLEAGEQDDIFPIAAVKACYAQLEELYRRLDASQNLGIDIFPAGHSISGKFCYDFMQEALSR